jgi:hypothetical protein
MWPVSAMMLARSSGMSFQCLSRLATFSATIGCANRIQHDPDLHATEIRTAPLIAVDCTVSQSPRGYKIQNANLARDATLYTAPHRIPLEVMRGITWEGGRGNQFC